jgi:hypothetical protein
MNDRIDKATEGWGLRACGASGRWDLAVDESTDGKEWTLELDSPQVYLVIQLDDVNVISGALRFLETGSVASHSRSASDDNDSIFLLGRFDSAPVSLVWDNEDFPRCFVVIGPGERSTLRLSFYGEDLTMFVEALREVVRDLSSP